MNDVKTPIFMMLLQNKQDNPNPFDNVNSFLGDIITGFTNIAAPIATLAFIGLGIAAMMSTDEHQRQKFKMGLWWTGLAALICFSAETIVDWIQSTLKNSK